MRPNLARAVVASFLVLAGAAAARADVVHFVDGGKVEGLVEEKGDDVRIVLQGGSITLPRSKIKSIDRAEPPHAIFDRRRAEVKDGDATAALALALFAEKAGLAQQAAEMFETAVAWAPGDKAAQAERRRWLIFSRVIAPDAAADAKLLADFGGGAKLVVTDHFRVAYDVPEEHVRARTERLEAAWRKLYVWGDALGLAPRPVDRRFEVMVFSTYARWAAAVGRPAQELRGLTGMFVSGTGRVLLYDVATSPDVLQAQQELAAAHTTLPPMQVEIDREREEIEKAVAVVAQLGSSDAQREQRKSLQVWIAKARETMSQNERDLATRATDLRRAEAGVGEHVARENLASATHETCHQLSFAAGVCRPVQPLWLIEGMATLFEVTSKTSFVLETANSGRLRDLRAAWKKGRVTRVADVVSDAPFSDRSVDRAIAYAEAWSVTHFLAVRRPQQLSAYALTCKATTPDGRMQEFCAAFGDLDVLEKEWKEHVRRFPSE